MICSADNQGRSGGQRQNVFAGTSGLILRLALQELTVNSDSYEKNREEDSLATGGTTRTSMMLKVTSTGDVCLSV